MSKLQTHCVPKSQNRENRSTSKHQRAKELIKGAQLVVGIEVAFCYQLFVPDYGVKPIRLSLIDPI